MKWLQHFGKREMILAAVVLALTAGLIYYKVQVLGYTMTRLQPEKGYFVRLIMDVEAHGQDVSVKVRLPIQSERQRIRREEQRAEAFHYAITSQREGRWTAETLNGSHRIVYSFFAQTEARKYPLPEGVPIATNVASEFQRYLQPTERIQSDHPEIVAKARELMPPGITLKEAIQNTYNYVRTGLKYLAVRGPTDALSANRLGEASCNGKNRLMVALFRARGIPARMAKGLILRNTRKRTTHAWTEVLVGDTWVPLCPVNGYFAEIPEHYLELAKGDQPAFVHSKHIGFDWEWVIQPQVSQIGQAVQTSVSNPLNILSYWTSLKEFHISLNLIMIILMVPIAATVVSFIRNVVGLVPFGTFMPALVAVSFQETGFWLGSILFFCVVLVSSAVNFSLIRLRLLHIPRLTIVLTFVVMSMFAVSIAGVKSGLSASAGVSLFPMAILTLTSERFTMTTLEDSWIEAIRRVVVTYVVSAACYYVIGMDQVRLVVAAFPELLLANIAINLVLGSWTGMRWTEYWRFRSAVRAHAAPSGAC
ncbi:MAG: hypothetical protein D6766_05280 [Verrucomicrobia bacterium]|nr:MAG: hypothetical protein D6766_05280 [Verrucomicrobiota bacterium]